MRYLDERLKSYYAFLWRQYIKYSFSSVSEKMTTFGGLFLKKAKNKRKRKLDDLLFLREINFKVIENCQDIRLRLHLTSTSKTWTQTLDPDPEKPGPLKTWTQKNLDHEKPGSWKTWTSRKMLKTTGCSKKIERPHSIIY